MNFLSLFTREEQIAGLEINETFLRLALLKIADEKKEKKPTNNKNEEVKKSPVVQIQFLIEEKLDPGTISNGIVQNKKSLVKSLQNIIKKSPVKIRYVIASIPADNVYSKIFSFPKTIGEERLEETMKLTVGFQLPVKPEEIYIDWEKTGENEANEVCLAAISKTTANPFIEALNEAKINPVAVEQHPLSIVRAADLEAGSSTLIKIAGEKTLGIFLSKNKTLRFSRILPEKLLNKKIIDEEIKKISDFYESENGAIKKSATIEELNPAEKLNNQIKDENKSKWLISIGAGLRGLIPRSQDTLISLMPIGTEDAYEYQKAVVFSEFISTAVIGLSIFFSAAFIGVLILMSTIQQKTLRQMENLSSLPIPAEAAELEEKARQLNITIDAASKILKTTPRWSKAVEQLKNSAVQGITVSNFQMGSPSAVFNIAGTAQTRDQLNRFKKSLDDSELFANVNLPLSNLEQRENIPFSMSFKLKNPQDMYMSN